MVTFNLPVHSSSTSEVAALDLNSSLNPTSMSEVNCYVVLVSAPDLNKSYCKYKYTSEVFNVGLLKGGFYTDASTAASVKFEVPSGKDRALRLIGFRVNATSSAGLTNAGVCSDFVQTSGHDSYVSEPFLVSEVGGLDMPAGGEKVVDMTATFAGTNQIGDCKGPAFPNGNSTSSGGPPAKLAITFQDSLGTSTNPFTLDKCLAMKVQVQDASGNRASIPSGMRIRAAINEKFSAASVGSFYGPSGASDNCDPGNFISPVSDQINIEFFNTVTNMPFTDAYYFFSPSNAQTPTGTLDVATLASSDMTLVSASTPFSFDTSSTTPFKYGVYDMFSHKSTASSSSGSPILVKANECRPASIQFLDPWSVPAKTMIYSFHAPIGLTSNGVGSSTVKFYPSSSDCTTGSSEQTSMSFAPTNATTSSHNFYYKVPTAMLFSFLVYNIGTGTPTISSGDLTGANNFWEARSSL